MCILFIDHHCSEISNSLAGSSTVICSIILVLTCTLSMWFDFVSSGIISLKHQKLKKKKINKRKFGAKVIFSLSSSFLLTFLNELINHLPASSEFLWVNNTLHHLIYQSDIIPCHVMWGHIEPTLGLCHLCFMFQHTDSSCSINVFLSGDTFMSESVHVSDIQLLEETVCSSIFVLYTQRLRRDL